jgi:hypothetical protein
MSTNDDRAAEQFASLGEAVDEACNTAEIALDRFLRFACRRFVSDRSLAQIAAADTGCDRAYSAVIKKLLASHISDAGLRDFQRRLEFCIEGDVHGREQNNNFNVDAAIYLLARACLGADAAVKQEFKLDVMSEINMLLMQSVLTDSGVGVTLFFRNKSGGPMVEASQQNCWNDDEKIIVRLVYAQK